MLSMNDSCVIERTSSIVVVRTEAKLKKDKGTRTCGDRRDDIERKTVAVGTWKNRLGVDGGGGGWTTKDLWEKENVSELRSRLTQDWRQINNPVSRLCCNTCKEARVRACVCVSPYYLLSQHIAPRKRIFNLYTYYTHVRVYVRYIRGKR